MKEERPGFLSVDDYLELPRDRTTWLLKPLIPVSGAALLYGQEKSGKALALDTPIPTPNGWRTMKDIEAGDKVFGSNGLPTTVWATSPVMENHECYKVTFGDDTSIIADANHEWTVHNSTEAKTNDRTLTTKQMHETGLTVGCYKGYKKAKWRIRLTQPLQYPPTKAPTLDPYCLGTWLGDGTSAKAELTSADQPIVDAWIAAGFDMQHSERYGYSIRKADKPAQFIHTMGLKNNKHIPANYLYGSYETRLALLQGLMDSDGSCEKGVTSGTPVFWNTNERLIEQVYELAVGLGARVKRHEKRATLYGKDCGPCYYLSIRATFPVFRLERKLARVTPDKQGFWPIVAIEPVDSVPVKCLMVDAPDHLYLAGQNCIPTHNSAIAVQMAAALTGAVDNWMGFPVVRTGPILYLQLDNPRSTWADRFEKLKNGGLKYNANLMLADRECLEFYPFDILQPAHMAYLHKIVHQHNPVAVFVDTLRESHSGDEDSSTTSRNVIANLVGATHPAALIIISHSRKPSMDGGKDLMADHRGSSYITGRMDAIMRMTKNKLYYGGRSIEEGSIKLERAEVDGALMFEEANDVAAEQAMLKVMTDPTLKSLRAKARALALMLAISEEAAMSRCRRHTTAQPNYENP